MISVYTTVHEELMLLLQPFYSTKLLITDVLLEGKILKFL